MTQHNTAPHNSEQWQKETSLHFFHTLKISAAENVEAREEAASSKAEWPTKHTTWPTTSGLHLESALRPSVSCGMSQLNWTNTTITTTTATPVRDL